MSDSELNRCDVTVWNRTKSKCDPLIDLGAKYKSSPGEVAASCDVTFAMLVDPESALAVACGEDGAASGMSSGKGYVDVSTVDGPTSKLINEQIKETGALFLEAPVSGSKKPAENGQLIFLTAGDKLLYDQVLILGLSIENAPDPVANQLNVRNGALVLLVPANSPAAKVGLRPTTRGFAGNIVLGDVIVSVDNKPIYLYPKARNDTEYKLETFSGVYRKLSGKDVVFEYPMTEA
ncbi:glyoxylate reductase 2 [Artemisia annua]|uniref:Glyoxylate reductase 2 n=1 Tax=Artemisia annua TaxID=35608 RepID=A0A2U1MAL7_ARTAN|nr:glyoxylate reductase 2 [Artemisia annua]